MASKPFRAIPASTHCRCCGCDAMDILYTGPADGSLTTMTTMLRGQTVVRTCPQCAHCQTDVLTDLDNYYAHEYELGRLNEEDDQLYCVNDGVPVFRAQHQARVLATLQPITADTAVLDYGAGKSLTMKRLVQEHPGFKPYVYDVSFRYRPVWETFTEASRCLGRSDLPNHRNAFDVITLFFVLEHVTVINDILLELRTLLRHGGTLYAVVPDPLVNVADLIVADHVNHFSRCSVATALRKNGFAPQEVDASSHFGALVIRASAVGESESACASWQPPPQEVHSSLAKLNEISAFWKGIESVLATAFADSPPGVPLAIYGAGFYGAYIRLLMGTKGRDIVQIVDRNPHLQGTTVEGIPVVAPENLRPDIGTVIVGLNPAVARASVKQIEQWNTRPLRFVYLD